MRVYHVGYLKHDKTLIVQVRRSVDYLDCEIWKYMGKRETTKKGLRERTGAGYADFLAMIRREGFPECERIVID